MPGLACYWLKSPNPQAKEPLDEFLDVEHAHATEFGPISGAGYRAKLYVIESPPHELPWASFLRQGFGGRVGDLIPPASGGAALLALEVEHTNAKHYFAI